MEGNYRPEVALDILNIYDHIPDSSSLSIRTSGLLGEQFLALNLGFYDEDLGSDFSKRMVAELPIPIQPWCLKI